MTIIIQNVVRIIVPFILMFGAYVTAYGHISPGGGFAGGTILAAGLILERFVGIKRKYALNKDVCLKGVSYSLISYGILKGIAFLEGAMHIEVIKWPLGSPGAFISAGVIPVLNILIGLTVMMAFVLLFDLFNEDLVGEGSNEYSTRKLYGSGINYSIRNWLYNATGTQ